MSQMKVAIYVGHEFDWHNFFDMLSMNVCTTSQEFVRPVQVFNIFTVHHFQNIIISHFDIHIDKSSKLKSGTAAAT